MWYNPGMPKSKDIAGQRFGRLVAVYPIPGSREHPRKWFCQCDCGATSSVLTRDLLDGNTTSCGCYIRELHASRLRTHGLAGTSTYITWSGMLGRCSNPQSDRYVYYGGRGIKVCERWHRFDLFLQDMGERPSKAHSLDRIDNNGDYEPGNCRWASKRTQSRNRRSNVVVEYQGLSMCLMDWAERLGMDFQTLRQRIQRYNWPIEKAFNAPIRPREHIVTSGDKSLTLREWSSITGIGENVLYDRIFCEHWPIEKALSFPVVVTHERDGLGRFKALESD